MSTTTSILLNTTKQERVTRSKKSVKVCFLNYNKAEEDERHQKGLQLRKRLRKERQTYKQYKKYLAQLPQRVYNALLNPDNADLLDTLAINSLVFRNNFFIFFSLIAASQDNTINNFDGEPANFNRVLSRLISGNVPFGNIGRIPHAVDALSAMGGVLGFRPFLNPPLVSSDSSVPSSDHSQGDDDEKDGDDNHGNDDKKRGGGTAATSLPSRNARKTFQRSTGDFELSKS